MIWLVCIYLKSFYFIILFFSSESAQCSESDGDKMPTVVLVDCGLSMGRLAGRTEREVVRPGSGKTPQEITIEDDLEIRQLAVQGLSPLLAQIETNCRLEHVAVLTFSSVCEVAISFTRDIEAIRAKLSSISCQDKSLLEAGLVGASSLILEEWGGSASSLNLNLVIVTDGSLGQGPMSLHHLVNTGPVEMKLPLPFQCNVSVICLADKVRITNIPPQIRSQLRTVYIQSINPYLKKSKEAYQKLFTKLGLASHMTSFHCLETGVLSEKSTELLFQEV